MTYPLKCPEVVLGKDEVAAGDLDAVESFVLEPDGELYLVGEAHTSDGDGVGAVQLDDDGEFGADPSTHCSIDLQRKLHALVRVAAVGIRSPVGFRAEELAEQVAV